MSQGKIIAFLGPQASGKSSLVKELVDMIPDAKAFYEGESFPDYVEDAFQNPDKRLRAFVYFHNLWLDQYKIAEEWRSAGKVALLDTFWFTNYFYLDTLPHSFERELVTNLMETISTILYPPDAMIYLDIEEKEMIKRIKSRGRHWEVNPDWLVEPVGVKKRHETYLKDPEAQMRYFPGIPIYTLPALESKLAEKAVQFIHSH